MRNRTIIFLWISVSVAVTAFLAFYIRTIFENSNELLDVSESVFDFSDMDFDAHGLVKLHGDIEFYKDAFLTPEDFNDTIVPDGLLHIPSKWNDYRTGSEKPAGHGYGTCRMWVNVPSPGNYGLKIEDIKSAYNIFINGVNFGGSGKVGKTSEGMVPSRYQKEFFFPLDTTCAEIIIQVSNFHHRKGGITGKVVFGPASKIITLKVTKIGIEGFLIGILFIMFVYHLALYACRKGDKSILYFSLLCLTMFLRTGYTSERVLLDIFPFLGWGVGTRLEYISFMGIPVFITMYIKSLFKNDIPNWLVSIIVWSSIICVFVVLLLNSTIFSYTPYFIQFVLGAASTYLLVLIFIAMLNGRRYAGPVFLGFFIFFILSIHDALFYSNAVQSTYLMPAGLFVVTLSQAYVLAIKKSMAHSEVEKLSEELREHANNLEITVSERTKEIQKQKEEIEYQKQNIEINANELIKTNEQLVELAKFKQSMTGMMIHDLKNPLNNIIGFTELSGSIDKFREYIHSSGWNMLNLIQNILDVEKYESVQFKINKSEISLNEIANIAYENTMYMISSQSISFENKIPADLKLNVDMAVLTRVFSNIFSNAAKYGGDDCDIKVYTEEQKTENGNFIKVNLYNSGEPIPVNIIEEIFDKYTRAIGAKKTHSFSSGIGLAFCKMAINAHGGEIGAISGKTKGVTFWFTLPV